jgi:hypothetical protein
MAWNLIEIKMESIDSMELMRDLQMMIHQQAQAVRSQLQIDRARLELENCLRPERAINRTYGAKVTHPAPPGASFARRVPRA